MTTRTQRNPSTTRIPAATSGSSKKQSSTSSKAQVVSQQQQQKPPPSSPVENEFASLEALLLQQPPPHENRHCKHTNDDDDDDDFAARDCMKEKAWQDVETADHHNGRRPSSRCRKREVEGDHVSSNVMSNQRRRESAKRDRKTGREENYQHTRKRLHASMVDRSSSVFTTATTTTTATRGPWDDGSSRTSTVLEKSRRVTEKQRNQHPQHPSSSRFNRQVVHPKPPVSVAPARSVVGSRPEHWAATPSRPQHVVLKHERGPIIKKEQQQHHHHHDTTRASTAGASSSHGGNRRKPRIQPPARPTNVIRTGPFSQRSAVHGAATTTPRQTEKDLPDKTAKTVPVSFAPTFLSSSSVRRTLEADTVESADDIMTDSAASSWHESASSPRPRSAMAPTGILAKGSSSTKTSSPKQQSNASHRKRVGPLVRRFQSLRDGIKGDCTRLRSGQYPFSTFSHDLNDPRNRASSYTDITLLSESTAWEAEPHHHWGITLLGFVHQHSVNGGILCPPKNDKQSLSSEFVWVCFTAEMARDARLGPGSQWRVYNAVFMPLHLAAHNRNEAAVVHVSSSDGDTAVHTEEVPIRVERIMLCTPLCEPYPCILPKLPDLTTIVANWGSGTLMDG